VCRVQDISARTPLMLAGNGRHGPGRLGQHHHVCAAHQLWRAHLAVQRGRGQAPD